MRPTTAVTGHRRHGARRAHPAEPGRQTPRSTAGSDQGGRVAAGQPEGRRLLRWRRPDGGPQRQQHRPGRLGARRQRRPPRTPSRPRSGCASTSSPGRAAARTMRPPTAVRSSYDDAARTAAASTPLTVSTRDLYVRATAQALPALRWAPLGPGTVATSSRPPAGSSTRASAVTISATSALRATPCASPLRGGAPVASLLADASGAATATGDAAAQATTPGPTTSSTPAVQVATYVYNVLAKAKLKAKAPKSVKRGKVHGDQDHRARASARRSRSSSTARRPRRPPRTARRSSPAPQVRAGRQAQDHCGGCLRQPHRQGALPRHPLTCARLSPASPPRPSRPRRPGWASSSGRRRRPRRPPARARPG